ncbi:hypothetical protein F442_00905 [Phytophthora nicotianae P10297]|uniref:PH domain-containing protein n=1 Tax=Phytophthora nicotianae P10297 TaxID=1317064 RepID=W3A568_PHYNI|nr:hypothetical protein F442_00905 [Phytophthora nicotianae P10297]
MEGFILMVTSEDQHRRSVQKKKQEWRNLFVKLDDISARLIAFTDRSQFEMYWGIYLVGADIATPVPGEPSNGIDVDDTPYCFYVRETSAVKDCTHYFSAPDDATKKEWVKALTQVVRDGPRAPRFAVTQPGNEFEFQARVVNSRLHVDGTHAAFFRFDSNCQNVDQNPRIAKGSQSRSRNTPRQDKEARRGPASLRLSDIKEDTRSPQSRASTASDAASKDGRSRPKGSQGAPNGGADERRASNSSQASASSRASTSSQSASSHENDGSKHHRCHHREKSEDLDQKERPRTTRPKSSKREPTINCGSIKAEIRLADPTA